MKKLGTPLSRILATRTGGWLVAHVEEYQERHTRWRVDPGWFHPSDLVVGCDAYLAFRFLGVKPKGKRSAKLTRIFDLGKGRDKDWKRYNKKSGISLIKRERERKIEITAKDCPICGEVDDIVKNPITGEIFVFEFKTINHDQFRALTKPLRQHCIQVTPYMVATGRKAIIQYEDKNTQDLKSFVYELDPQLWNQIKARIANILNQLQNNQIPLRSPVSNEKQCPFYYCCSTFDLRKFNAKKNYNR